MPTQERGQPQLKAEGFHLPPGVPLAACRDQGAIYRTVVAALRPQALKAPGSPWSPKREASGAREPSAGPRVTPASSENGQVCSSGLAGAGRRPVQGFSPGLGCLGGCLNSHHKKKNGDSGSRVPSVPPGTAKCSACRSGNLVTASYFIISLFFRMGKSRHRAGRAPLQTGSGVCCHVLTLSSQLSSLPTHAARRGEMAPLRCF